MKKLNKVFMSIVSLLIVLASISNNHTDIAMASYLSQTNTSESLIWEITGEDVQWIENEKLPYYSMENDLEVFVSGDLQFRIDSASGQIIEIMPTDPGKLFPIVGTWLNEDDLENLATTYIVKAKINVDFSALNLEIFNKEETNYFFRWSTGQPNTPEYGKNYIQIGFTKDGQFLNLVNTLPFSSKMDSSSNKSDNNPMAFNEIYANRGGYWQSWGNPTQVSGYGYCGSSSGYWCSPHSIDYAYTESVSRKGGKWLPNANSNTKAAAYIPSNYATTTSACYYVNNISSACVNQSIYFNTWVTITPNKYTNGITVVSLNNNSSNIGTMIAWDEIWVFDS